MLILRRSVRFSINPSPDPGQPGFPGENGYAGVPAMNGLGRYFQLNVTCRGSPDPTTGYLVNIKDIDNAVRRSLIPRLEDACRTRPHIDPASLLPELLQGLEITSAGARDAAGPVTGDRRIHCSALRWQLTPYYSVEMNADDATTVLLRQRFDFAASHRLHVDAFSDSENQALFGKCNNPGGHGHNYQFEPCIAVRLGSGNRPSFSLAQLERLAVQTIVERFDHKHLNLDTVEFCPERGGVNPTVENIARVFYDLFALALAQSGASARLESMTVWETDRTSATYPA